MIGTILGAVINILLDPILISFAGIVLLLTVLFQATGKIVPSFILSISRQGIVFVFVLLICVKIFTYNGVLMGQAVSDMISSIIAIILLVFCNPMKS